MPTRRRLYSQIFLLVVILGSLITVAFSLWVIPLPSSTLVISQIYGGGGNAGATYKNDFIELFNRGTTTVTLTGWTVQYASSTSATWVTTGLTGTLAPGQYFLIQEAAGTGGTLNLPAPDVTGTLALAATAGKVALVNTTALLSGTCPTGANIVDLVGFGSGSNCFEGAGVAPAPSNTNALLRAGNGCVDTDNNASDFAVGLPAPRNSTLAAITCSALPTSTPTAMNTTTRTATSTATRTSTPLRTATATALPPAEKILITQVVYDGIMVDEGDEFVEIYNPLTHSLDLGGYKIGDEETKGGGESMYLFPSPTWLAADATLIVAKNAAQFRARFGIAPTFELVTTGALTDTASVPNLAKYTAWATGSWSLANSGDEILLLGPSDQWVDAVAWGSGNFAAVGLRGHAKANAPLALQRYDTSATQSMTLDFLSAPPNPGTRVVTPAPPAPKPGAVMPDGMFAFWGDLHAHSTVSDGDGPPRMAFDTARANGLHFFALTDHDSSMTAEAWDATGSAVRDTTSDGAFIGLRGFEYTNPNNGHVNVYNGETWITHDDPNYDTYPEFYTWLAAQPASVVAQFNHPDPTYGGDFNYFAFNAGAFAKIALQEVGNNGGDNYTRYDAELPISLRRGWHVAPTNNSDHHALAWGSDSPHRVGVIAPSLTLTHVIEAFQARRIFATEDANLALAFQARGVWMGGTITAQPVLTFTVTLADPDAEAVQIDLMDNGVVVRTQNFSGVSALTWNITVNGSSSHAYYARVTQADGDLAFSAPIWTDATALPTPILPTTTPREKTWELGNVSVETARTTNLNKRVQIEGCVTVPPDVFSDRYIFVQDAMGGIKVYVSSRVGNFPTFKVNDRVSLRGIVRLTSGEREINVTDDDTLELRGTCGTVVPRRYATGDIAPAAEGWLVEISGTIGKVTSRYEFELNDGSGAAIVSMDSTTHLRLPTTMRSGQAVRIIGVVSRVRGRLVVIPRFDADLDFGLRPTAMPTLRVITPTITRTPTPTPRAATVTATASRVAATPRAFAPALPARGNTSATLDAYAVAEVGATTTLATGALFFVLGFVLWRRK